MPHITSTFLILMVIMKYGIYGHLNATCSSLAGNRATLAFSGDAIHVYAIGRDNQKCSFSKDFDTTTFNLTAKYDQESAEDCVCESMYKDKFTLDVIARMKFENMDSEDDPHFKVACNLEITKNETNLFWDGVVVPSIPGYGRTGVSGSNFSLELKHFDGTKNTKPLTLGTTVMLKAFMQASQPDVRFIVTSCEASASDGSDPQPIIADGCGTGYPFSSNTGFLTRKLVAVSPKFQMFKIKDEYDVFFKCKFVTCAKNCDELSCSGSRKQRRLLSYGKRTHSAGFYAKIDEDSVPTIADISYETVDDFSLKQQKSVASEDYMRNAKRRDVNQFYAKRRTIKPPMTSSALIRTQLSLKYLLVLLIVLN